MARYFEPFVGGGALFFSVQHHHSFLSDVNDELVNVYRVVKSQVEELIEELRTHRYENEYFYEVRALDRSPTFRELPALQRASRFIFLNKTCFNGLYRVNSRGQFNVPFGDYNNPKIVDEHNLRACSTALRTAEIACESYLEVEERLAKGDFVYFDPPYAPLSVTSNFTSYSAGGFSSKDQEELRELCIRLDQRGVKFMVSNSSAPLILELYKGFKIDLIAAGRAINSKGSARGKVSEAIITNY